jgi:3-hydroxyisobutyrate dehydrogenase-like beta-hydroxyacid dehydrogenase
MQLDAGVSLRQSLTRIAQVREDVSHEERSSMIVGVVSPGAMGSSLGAAFASAGHRVVATLDGRSPRTRALAEQAGLELVRGLDDVVAAAQVVLSVVPPGEARDVARAIADTARRAEAAPLFADLNAISPSSATAIERELAADGLELVDGSISGPPPRRPGTTRLYLSGRRAREIERLAPTGVTVRVLGDAVGTASALKMCTASVYKGSVALLTHALLTARAHGVVDEVLEDLAGAYPNLVDHAAGSIARAAAKAERYVPEMREIASTQAAAELPAELFDGVAAVFDAIARMPAARRAPEEVGEPALADVLDELAS